MPKKELFGIEVAIAAPEDLILYKLIACRPKDEADIEGIVQRRGDKLDIAYLRKWAEWLSRETAKPLIMQTLKKYLPQHFS